MESTSTTTHQHRRSLPCKLQAAEAQVRTQRNAHSRTTLKRPLGTRPRNQEDKSAPTTGLLIVCALEQDVRAQSLLIACALDRNTRAARTHKRPLNCVCTRARHARPAAPNGPLNCVCTRTRSQRGLERAAKVLGDIITPPRTKQLRPDAEVLRRFKRLLDRASFPCMPYIETHISAARTRFTLRRPQPFLLERLPHSVSSRFILNLLILILRHFFRKKCRREIAKRIMKMRYRCTIF